MKLKLNSPHHVLYRKITHYKEALLVASLFFLQVAGIFAQTGSFTVTGKVTGNKGQPAIGVSITEKGRDNGTTSSENGAFKITVNSGNAILVFTSIGYETLEVNIDNKPSLDVVLKESVGNLSEVVVTALGIQRKAKSLTYSTQIVKGDDLTKVKDANPMNNLTGKVSGLQINRSSSGIGGSVNITLRGLKSLRNNQPLYVIDGLPVANVAGSGPSGPFGGGTDRGDILSTLNADDIVSINVLKGATASALYGSEGANGAIMITTRKGAAGATKIDISSSITFDRPFYLPRLQYSYGQSASDKGDAEESWGEKGNFKNHVDDFFQTGTTLINSVSLSGGNERLQNYFSYANTTNKGIMPANKFNQHTLSFRNTTKFFNDKLVFDGSIMYSNQNVENRPSSGLYFGVLPGLYMFPRGRDWDDFRNNFEYLSPTRNLMLQNWYNINADKGLSGTHHTQNPFWVLYRNPTFQHRHNIISSASLRYALTDWLNISARGTLNRIWNKFERRVYAGTQGVISGQTSTALATDNGRYLRDESNGWSKYGDILLSGDRDLTDNLGLTFTAGASISDFYNEGWSLDARKLTTANSFGLDNIFRGEPNSMAILTESFKRVQKQAVFASTNLGFKEMVYLDLTARNDWSSSLAFTPNEKSGYFYYSAGMSLVLSEMFNLPAWNNLSKLRFTYAKVGNDVEAYASYVPEARLYNGTAFANTSGLFENEPLKPELTKSLELGYEGRFVNNRLNVDIALYKSNTINQYVSFNGPLGLVTSTFFMNAGDVENKGIEVAIGYDIIKGRNFGWSTGLNYTANRNKVLKLHPRLTSTYPIGNFNVLRVGGSFGDFWGKTFQRDANGKIVVNDDGSPRGAADGYIGSSNPKALAGWTNTFSYRRLALTLNIDGRFGGDVISITQGYLNSFGYSKESADARDAGGIMVDFVKQDGTPVTKVDAQKYYQGIGNRDGIIEGQVYDATNIRLRELSLAYRIPVKSSWIREANISLVGRNLFFFKNNAPYDPELNTATGASSSATGTGNNNTPVTGAVGQGFDIFGLPATRSFGINLKLGF